MRFKGLLLFVLLIGGCSAEKLTSLPKTAANRYGLTTEATLPREYHEHIRPYFDRGEGKRSRFKSGVEIAYRIFQPEKPPAVEKGAIVISSGRTEGMVIYQELIYDLQKQGYRVYILDHRGQGSSERLVKEYPERGHVDHFDNFVEDLHEFVTTVVPKEPKPYLLAHSMGGCIASLYLEKYPGDFKAAALVTPMHEPVLWKPWTTTLFAFINRRFPSSWAADSAFFQHPYDPPKFSENEITQSKLRYAKQLEIYEENPEAKLGGVSHGWIREAYAAGKRARQDATRIKVPVLLLQGGADSVVRPGAQVEFCKNMKGRCTGYVVEGARHAIFNEADEYRLPALTTILDFFGKA
jgi:lysophospholipase